MADIEYFYSAHSAFAYLGSARFMAIAAAAERRIVHKPIDLNRVIAAAGSTAFRARSEAFRAYFFNREIERWAEHRNAPVMDGRPTHHHKDMTLPNCMLIAGVEQGHNIDRLAHVLLEAHRRDDADLADRATLTDLGRSAGLDPEPLLQAALTPDIQAIYGANTAEAIARSVFGSPTYFVDGDMFYGQDRLEMIERALGQPYAGTWPKG
jgi:2-hydroxychromene-2-carboxylate isomerase